MKKISFNKLIKQKYVLEHLLITKITKLLRITLTLHNKK